MKSRTAIVALLSASLIAPDLAEACSRAVYFGKEGQTVTGRTMDWFVSDMDTNSGCTRAGSSAPATPRRPSPGRASTAAS